MIAQLYTKFFNQLLWYTVSMCHNRAAAEDIVQECFMRAMEHSDLLDTLSEQECRAWLYKTAKNLYIDKARKAAALPVEIGTGISDDDLTRVVVEQICSALPEKERSLFALRYFSGYNATELGQMYGLPPSTVRAKLSYARKILKEMMKE